MTLPFSLFEIRPFTITPSTAIHVFAPACALGRSLGVHLSTSSHLRRMPFLDTQNYPPESVSSPPARCPALPGESSLWWPMRSTSFYNQTKFSSDEVTLGSHEYIKQGCSNYINCSAWNHQVVHSICCKHALINCGMSRMHDMMIYNILLNSSCGFLLISYFKRFLCRHCPRLR